MAPRRQQHAVLKTAQEEMKVSLGEWGVSRGLNHQHKRYYDARIDEVEQYIQGGPKKQNEWTTLVKEKATSHDHLPKDLLEAIRFVLLETLSDSNEREEGDKFYYEAQDKLGMEYRPFFRWNNALTKESGYARRREFEKFTKREIDPLQRFHTLKYTSSEWFHHIWFERPAASSSLGGTVFEARVAHYMETNMPCHGCKFRNCLKWHGGIRTLSSWADVVCTRLECQAIYEIKSRDSDERVDKDFYYNKFRGGSFRMYCAHPSQGRRYIVIVSRRETLKSSTTSVAVQKAGTPIMIMAHRVSIAEIEKVLPRLCTDSFIETGHACRIISEVVPRKMTIKKEWFLLPTVEADFESMAREAFVERFGRAEWTKLQQSRQRERKGREEGEDLGGTDTGDSSLEALKAELEGLKLRKSNNKKAAAVDRDEVVDVESDDGNDDDDWENLYDDSV